MKNKILVISAIVVAIILVAGGLFYFTNNYKVQIKPKTYTVTTGQAGLPSDMNWTVSEPNQPFKFVSSSSFITLQLGNGKYSFLPLASHSTYYSSSINITVSGSNVTCLVSFNAIPQSVIAVNVDFNYLGTTSGYFGPSTQTFAGSNYDAGFTLIEDLELKSSASLFDHNISSIRTNTPGFSVISISPALPVSVSPGGTVTIVVTVQTAPSRYSGALDLIINTY